VRVRVIFALILLAVAAALPALAYASPPDPVWVSGIFDDDDADDVIQFIESATALVEPLSFHIAPPTPVMVERPVQNRETLPVCPASSANPVRAPPTS
jgi:hypothetical protein